MLHKVSMINIIGIMIMGSSREVDVEIAIFDIKMIMLMFLFLCIIKEWHFPLRHAHRLIPMAWSKFRHFCSNNGKKS